MKRLIVCDFDGTLYQKGCGRQFHSMLSLLTHSEVPFVVASGRPWHMLRQYFEDVLDRIYLVSNDGALITKGEQILYAAPIPPEGLTELCEDRDFVAYGALLSYLKIGGTAERIRWRQTFRQHAMEVRHVTEISEPIYKIFFPGDVVAPPFLQPTYARNGVTEFAREGVHKGTALRYLAEREDISTAQCYAFGDGENDRELFASAGHSAAMVHSPPKVKESADRVCTAFYEELKAMIRGDFL